MRIVLTMALGIVFAFFVPRWLGLNPRLAAAAAASLARLVIPVSRTWLLAGTALPLFGIVYLAASIGLGIPGAVALTAKLRRRVGV